MLPGSSADGNPITPRDSAPGTSVWDEPGVSFVCDKVRETSLPHGLAEGFCDGRPFRRTSDMDVYLLREHLDEPEEGVHADHRGLSLLATRLPGDDLAVRVDHGGGLPPGDRARALVHHELALPIEFGRHPLPISGRSHAVDGDHRSAEIEPGLVARSGGVDLAQLVVDERLVDRELVVTGRERLDRLVRVGRARQDPLVSGAVEAVLVGVVRLAALRRPPVEPASARLRLRASMTATGIGPGLVARRREPLPQGFLVGPPGPAEAFVSRWFPFSFSRLGFLLGDGERGRSSTAPS